MKIVVLNKCFFEKKHIDRLRRFGSVIFYKDTRTEDKVILRLRGAAIAIANGMVAPLTKKVFARAADLRLLVINSTGVDFVDLDAARRYGIKVANLPGYATDAVAEHAFALIFSINRKIIMQDRKMRGKCFEINPTDGGNLKFLSSNLRGKTLGIFGFGAIGQRVAELGLGINMKVIAYDRVRRPFSRKAHWVSRKKLIRESDVLSLHMPLTSETLHIIGSQELRSMKRGAILINTSRGKLVDENALYRSLKNGTLAGAGLDVLADFSPKNPLLKLPNVVLTPHSAWWTKESLHNQAEMIVQTIEKLLRKNEFLLLSNYGFKEITGHIWKNWEGV